MALIKNMVVCYFNIIRKIVVDQVPKAIMSELVGKSEKEIQSTLFKDIYEYKDLNQLVNESEESKEKREKLVLTIEALKQAYDLICSL